MGPPPAMMEAKIAGVADLLLQASVLGGQAKWREWLSVVWSNGSIRLRIAKQTKSVVVCSRAGGSLLEIKVILLYLIKWEDLAWMKSTGY